MKYVKQANKQKWPPLYPPYFQPNPLAWVYRTQQFRLGINFLAAPKNETHFRFTCMWNKGGGGGGGILTFRSPRCPRCRRIARTTSRVEKKFPFHLNLRFSPATHLLYASLYFNEDPSLILLSAARLGNNTWRLEDGENHENNLGRRLFAKPLNSRRGNVERNKVVDSYK